MTEVQVDDPPPHQPKKRALDEKKKEKTANTFGRWERLVAHDRHPEGTTKVPFFNCSYPHVIVTSNQQSTLAQSSVGAKSLMNSWQQNWVFFSQPLGPG